MDGTHTTHHDEQYDITNETLLNLTMPNVLCISHTSESTCLQNPCVLLLLQLCALSLLPSLSDILNLDCLVFHDPPLYMWFIVSFEFRSRDPLSRTLGNAPAPALYCASDVAPWPSTVVDPGRSARVRLSGPATEVRPDTTMSLISWNF